MSVPIAAIDVGSNSVRVAVMSRSAHGGLDVIEEARAVPRLIRDVEEHGKFRVLDRPSDFKFGRGYKPRWSDKVYDVASDKATSRDGGLRR